MVSELVSMILPVISVNRRLFVVLRWHTFMHMYIYIYVQWNGFWCSPSVCIWSILITASLQKNWCFGPYLLNDTPKFIIFDVHMIQLAKPHISLEHLTFARCKFWRLLHILAKVCSSGKPITFNTQYDLVKGSPKTLKS